MYIRLWDVLPKPREEFELRVVVWDTDGVKLNDGEFSDVKVSANIGMNIWNLREWNEINRYTLEIIRWRWKF